MRPYLKFLSALAEHNSKEWMDDNKKWYLDARAEFIEDVTVILKGVEAFEPAMAAFKAKDCIFRINRDVRFSANKNPYKNNFSAYFSPKGKKVEWPGYYVHVQPGASFIGGGLWMPSSGVLKKIRKEIDYSGGELQEILEREEISDAFSGIEGEKLKTSPRDYDTDHEFIEFLKLKSFILSKPIADSDIDSGNYINVALDGFQRMKPFQEFLSRAIEDVEDGSGIL
jgi:uncharacterized protein (TIGR02453 family)